MKRLSICPHHRNQHDLSKSTGWPKLKYPSSKFAISWQSFGLLPWNLQHRQRIKWLTYILLMDCIILSVSYQQNVTSHLRNWQRKTVHFQCKTMQYSWCCLSVDIYQLVQHIVAISMQFSHTWYSKCPPLALMHALNCLVKLRMDLSMGSCGKIDWRATFNSENICQTWLVLLVEVKHSTSDMVVKGV